jgi:hypothetical protein
MGIENVPVRVALIRCEEPSDRSKVPLPAGNQKSDPGESVWLAPFEPTGAVLIMAVAEETVKSALRRKVAWLTPGGVCAGRRHLNSLARSGSTSRTGF